MTTSASVCEVLRRSNRLHTIITVNGSFVVLPSGCIRETFLSKKNDFFFRLQFGQKLKTATAIYCILWTSSAKLKNLMSLVVLRWDESPVSF